MSLLYDSRTLHLSYVHFNKHDPVPAVVREICSAVTHDLTLDRVRESAMETGDRPHEYACVPSFLSFLGARERAERPGVTVGTSCPHLACSSIVISTMPLHARVSVAKHKGPQSLQSPTGTSVFPTIGRNGIQYGVRTGLHARLFTRCTLLLSSYVLVRVPKTPRRPSFLLVVSP